MKNSNPYIRERDFTVFGVVGLCATTKIQLVEEIFEIPKDPCSATVDLIGVPGIIAAKENEDIAEMYNNATFAVIDGMPIVKKAVKMGIKCERCAAPDIMAPIFLEGVKRGSTHYFYGGKNNEVLRNLKYNLEKDYQGIKIVGMYSPPFRDLSKEEDQEICDEINRLKPDFVWVGIGAPRQEIWMMKHQTILKNTVMLGVGAGFDYISKSLKKAPAWVEKAGFEWLYRLVKEPHRLWKRYIVGGLKFLFYRISSIGTREKYITKVKGNV